MGKKTPKAPAAPDPTVTAQAQTASNKETAYWNALLNNVNQVTPYGTLTYADSSGGVYDPNKPPQFTSTINLTPEAQSILDKQMQSENALAQLGVDQLGRIQSAASTPFSFSGLTPVFGEGDALTAQTRAEEALMSRLDPQFQRDEESLRTRLINQGIGQGSEAYNREFERFNQAKNDARMQSVLSGQQYASALLGDSLTRRNQGIQEYTTQRNAPLNEYNAFMSGTQVENPQFSSAGYQGANPVDYASLVNQKYQGDLANYNAQVAGRNNMMGSLFSLGSSFLGGPAAGRLF
jgi:hypothetical protein